MVASAELVSSPMQPFLQVVEISKMFPGVHALDAVNVDIFPGEVHCWIGENGAGKSTLVKILAGGLTPSSGEIRISNAVQNITSPHHAQQLGLSFIFQELSVVNGLSVADNILLGNELSRGPLVLPSASFTRTKELLTRIGFSHLDPNRKVGLLSTAEKQAVMVARALNIDAKVIFMDETTSTLDRDEVDNLFSVIEALKSEGRSIVFISHRLNEVEAIADRITIFKDGGIVGTYSAGELTVNMMIRKMVGRDIANTFPAKSRTFGKTVLEIQDLSTVKISNVNLAFQSGKITGIAGLVGSGRTELMNALFGLDRLTSGSISMEGEIRRFRNCRDAIRFGIGLVPEDRRGQGIIGLRSVEENISITWAIGKPLRTWKRDSVDLAKKFISSLNIKTPNIGKQVGQLSGGNQQKCVVARWLAVAPQILLLDEPTRGIDISAKTEMYQIIDRLARDGMAVVIVSSDLPELLGLADEIAVMREGLFMGMLGGDSSEEEVMSLAMGDIN